MQEELVPKEPLTKKTRLHLSVDSETKDKAEAYCRGFKVTISRLFQETIERIVDRQQLRDIETEFSNQLKIWQRIDDEYQAVGETVRHIEMFSALHVRITRGFPERTQAEILDKIRPILAAKERFECEICRVIIHGDHFEPDLRRFEQFLDLLTRFLDGFQKLRELRNKWISLIDFKRIRPFRKGRLVEEGGTLFVEDFQGLRHRLDELDQQVWKMCDSSLSAADIQDQMIQVSGYSSEDFIASMAGLFLWKKLLGEAQNEPF